MKYGIYYFSGTGNSLWSAKQISQALEDSKIVAISQEINKDDIVINEQNLILIFPSYAYEIPLIVRRFIKKATINSKRITAIVTYGSHYGGSLAEVKRILKRKKLKLNYATGIRCVENYLPIFGSPKEKKKAKRLLEQKIKTTLVIENIQKEVNNKIISIRPLSIIVSSLFRLAKPLLVKFYKVHENCNGCGICAKVCPANAIMMYDKKGEKQPAFNHKKCEHCQACFNYCPQKAISLLRLKPHKAHYHHPDIELKDMLN